MGGALRAEQPVAADQTVGVFLVMGGALLLSLKGIVAKFLYAEGVDYTSVVAIRAMLAAPLFWAWALWTVGLSALTRVSTRDVLISAAAGLLCYYLGAYTNFLALTIIDASVERVLLFSYPAIVVVAQAILAKRLPSTSVVVATLCTYAGIFLVVGGFDPELLAQNWFGASLVMFCACTIAIYFFANASIGKRIGSIPFTVFAMTAAAIGLGAHFSVVVGTDVTLTRNAWLLMILLVVFVTVLPLFMVAEGVKRLGAERSSIVSTVGPPATFVFAWLLLGETMRPSQIAGMALILAGIIALERRAPSSPSPPGRAGK